MLRSSIELVDELLNGDANRYNRAYLREYTLCYLGQTDCFSVGRVEALSLLLQSLESHPNLMTDKRRLKNLVGQMNRILEQRLEALYLTLDRAFERYNDNIALGRPAMAALETLTTELLEAGVFLCPQNPEGRAKQLFETLGRIERMVETSRAGKTHPNEAIRSVTSILEKLVREGFDEESHFWYNEVSVKHYVRDTIIPHAILNNYLDPKATSDLTGSLLHFLRDSSANRQLIYCTALLFHQPQHQGERFVRASDLIDELKLRVLNPTSLGVEKRYSEKVVKGDDADRGEPVFADLFTHPYLRLARPTSFLSYLLKPYLEEAHLPEEYFERWLSHSLFSIDPSYGLAARALTEALIPAVQLIVSKNFKPYDAQLRTELQSRYNYVLEAKCDAILTALRAPFESTVYQEKGKFDPFELKEAVVEVLVHGAYQEDSDWPEEQELAETIRSALKVISKNENTEVEVSLLESALQEIASSLEKVYERASSIQIDSAGLVLWYILTFEIVGNENDLTAERMNAALDLRDLSFPINALAIREHLKGDTADRVRLALDSIREMTTPMTKGVEAGVA